MTRRDFVAGAAMTALSASRVRGANDRISVAMVGVGGRNLLGEALEFHKQAGVDIRVICDIWKQHSDEGVARAEQYSGLKPEAVPAYHDVLAREDIDAVIIATPDHQHCTQLIQAMKAGKDVYIEKPLAMDMDELNAAFDAVKATDRVVQMGTQVRSFAASVGARDFIRKKGLGRIFKVEQARNSFHPYWHRYGERPIDEKDTDWNAFLMHRKHRPWNAQQHAGWFGYRDFSAGPHSNLAVHFFDLFHYLTDNGAPRRATAVGDVLRWTDEGYTTPDSVEVVFEYPGCMVRYCSTFGVKGHSFLKLFGTRGVMDASRWSDPFVISGDSVEDDDRIQPGETVPEMESTPHMLNFFQCIRTRETPNAPIEAGYSHSVAAIMADEAMIRGRRMVFDEKKRKIREG